MHKGRDIAPSLLRQIARDIVFGVGQWYWNMAIPLTDPEDVNVVNVIV